MMGNPPSKNDNMLYQKVGRIGKEKHYGSHIKYSYFYSGYQSRQQSKIHHGKIRKINVRAL